MTNNLKYIIIEFLLYDLFYFIYFILYYLFYLNKYKKYIRIILMFYIENNKRKGK